MKKLILIIVLIAQSVIGDEYQALQDKLANYQKLLRNNAGTVEQRNYYRRQVTKIRSELRHWNSVTLDLSQDMQAKDTVISDESLVQGRIESAKWRKKVEQSEQDLFDYIEKEEAEKRAEDKAEYDELMKELKRKARQ